MAQRSPGGSVFPYYYKGGEIHCLKYGSFGSDGERLVLLMEEETEFIRRRSAARFRVWVDFYETRLSEDVLYHFTEQIVQLQDQLVKLAIVGLSAHDQARIRKLFRNVDPPVSTPRRFYGDPEDAKTWLVKEISDH